MKDDFEYQDDFIEEIGKIHAPRDLINRTKLLVNQEVEKEVISEVSNHKIFHFNRYLLAALVLLMIGGGTFVYQHLQDDINITQITVDFSQK
ncbi:hypothetical protein Hs30E_20680 [Lactococcus hodotermopsidis]|uniref:Uncharacterized protein n=1 Tax=Pseudolactococcus hodotermopsidis TaxID=2709157 RepID=A0A6A0BGJ9_9LACT|nr:hypothetical protein [Lactococcus hodotermopsidis]GFH43488.1 hypothetical protein Hs30E_20680 [Lactococcus hodotermopsidis]